MAGVIVRNGLNVMAQGSNPSDFNECKQTGIYSCGGLVAENAPVSNPYGTLIVFGTTGSNVNYTVQLFVGKNGQFYFRSLDGSWVQLT